MTNPRKCKQCGKELVRKRYPKRLESYSKFSERQFCNVSCSTSYRHGKNIKRPDVIKEASKKIETGNESEKITALEFLENVINDPGVDVVTGINAAKALAPYRHKKAEAVIGIKEQKAGMAKKASSGRFSAGQAPGQIARVK